LSKKDVWTLSSILKALKKLEEDSAIQKARHPWSSDPNKIQPAPARIYFRWPLNTVLIFCFFAFVLTLAGWFTGKLNVFTGNDDENPIPKRQPGLAYSHSVDDEYSRVAAEKIPVKQTITEPDRTMNNSPRLASAGRSATPQLSADDEKPPSTPTLPGYSGTQIKSVSGTTVPTIEPRKKDSRIQLQAIAWSNNPEKRMAVINNKIVREGGSIDGISVTRILEDQVIFREGEERFKILFGSN